MIDWNTVITTILASTTITTIVLAIIGFVAKSIFTQFMSRDIERVKSSHEVELEKFKASLQQSALEHQVRYQSLHIKRAEVIAELYKLLVRAVQDVNSLASPFQGAGEPPQEEKQRTASQSGRALNDFFEQNRIYFKPESCNRIANFIWKLYKAIIDFTPVLNDLANPHFPQKRVEKWGKVWKELTEELPPIKTEIEQEFREILGL
jgi:hypothetical protein